MVIYLVFRDTNIVLFQILKELGIYELLIKYRIYLGIENEYFSGWILYNLPDGLWFYSFVSFILILWNKEVSDKI